MTDTNDTTRDIAIEVRTDVKYIRELIEGIGETIVLQDNRIKSLEDSRTKGWGVMLGLGLGGGIGGSALWSKIATLFTGLH